MHAACTRRARDADVRALPRGGSRTSRPGPRRSTRRSSPFIGATGHQGDGLTHAIPDDPQRQFALRAITRNPDSAPARALAARGAEVTAADLVAAHLPEVADPDAYGCQELERKFAESMQ